MYNTFRFKRLLHKLLLVQTDLFLNPNNAFQYNSSHGYMVYPDPLQS